MRSLIWTVLRYITFILLIAGAVVPAYLFFCSPAPVKWIVLGAAAYSVFLVVVAACGTERAAYAKSVIVRLGRPEPAE